jgi:hypothetical protein
MRGEPLAATAVRYSRFLLLEVPGSWGSSPLDTRPVAAGVAAELSHATADAGINILLIRRPGRALLARPAAAGGRASGRPAVKAWALADTAPGSERVQWGQWRDGEDLLGLDLTGPLPAAAGDSGPQRVALVCTNGKRDQCCAIRGRPVAASIAEGSDWDAWECSHLGGHRFAATIMLLPTGDMFGWLDPGSALTVVRGFDAGQLMLSHYRGRPGQAVPVQAALHAAAVRLGEDRRDAIGLSWARPLPAATPAPGADLREGPADAWEAEVIHRPGGGPPAAYRVIVAGSRLAPSLLSCADDSPKAETRYEAISFRRA